MIYSTSELMQKYSNYADAKGKIRRLVRDGKLIQFARGLYEDNAAIDPAYLASADKNIIQFIPSSGYSYIIKQYRFHISC